MVTVVKESVVSPKVKKVKPRVEHEERIKAAPESYVGYYWDGKWEGSGTKSDLEAVKSWAHEVNERMRAENRMVRPVLVYASKGPNSVLVGTVGPKGNWLESS